MKRRAWLHLDPSSIDAPASPPLYRVPPAYAGVFPFNRLGTPPRRPPVGKREAPAPRPLGIQAGLDAHVAPLDRPLAAHLLRRTGFGADPLNIDALVGKTADAAVDDIVDAAVALPLPEAPDWIDDGVPRDDAAQQTYFFETNPERLNDFYTTWMQQIYDGGLREKMTLFWHNHFVTQIEAYVIAPYAYRYVNTLRTHALGNFKDVVRAVGTDPAMLIYLNGNQNTVGEPNENYARELLELFTMGQFDAQGNQNYTQQDIEQLARALTGWIVDPYNLTVQLVTILHDYNEKTIFGRTGFWDYDEVIDLLFDERRQQIATFICRKLYSAFIYAAPDDAIVAELTQVFLDNDFEIAPALRALFKSAHFYDAHVLGAQIKSPVEMLAGLYRETRNVPIAPQFYLLYFASFILEQRLLSPPNVAGWAAHHAWVNTSTLPVRWIAAEALIFGNEENGFPELDLVPLAEHLLHATDETIDPADPRSVFTLAHALAKHLIPVPLDTLDLSVPSEGFVGDLISYPIPDEVLDGPGYVRDLAKIFLLGIVPWHEWSLSHTESNAILMRYTRYLTQLPEYQLT